MSEEKRTCSWCPHVKKKRSGQHHRFFFAVISAAFDNWPPAHRFQPANPEELRGWLLVQVGHCDSVEIDLTTYADAKTIAEQASINAIRAIKGALPKQNYNRLLRTNTGLVMQTPRSIAEDKGCDGAMFQAVADKVIGEISFILGIPADMLKSEANKRLRDAA